MIKKITLLALLFLTAIGFSQTTIVNSGAIWKYYYKSSAPANDTEGDTWKQNSFNDNSWSSGASKLGNDHSPATTVGTNPVVNTIYFRHTFNVTDASIYSDINISAVRDDGIVVYLNGVEIWRDNMPTGTITHSTFSSATVADPNEIAWYASGVLSNTLITGSNTIAVEVHQTNATSSDLSFDLKLSATVVLTPTPTAEAIPANGVWRYLDNGSNQGTAWRANGFDDASWAYGHAELGYADSPATTVSFGLNSNSKYITTYFRKEFTIADKSLYQSIDLGAVRDDGMVVYLNGTEVWRDHISGTVDYLTLADDPAIGGTDESTWIYNNIASTLLVDGVNTIAVEIHQQAVNSSDLSFNFELTPSALPVGAATVTRGPYLQSGTPTSVVIKWRTNNATDSKVNYGSTLGSLGSYVSDATLKTNHEVTITGLTPSTKYYYEIADGTNILVPQEAEMYIKTSPPHGTKKFVRMWALGDAGTNGQSAYGTQQKDVRDAYYNYVASASKNPSQTDMMLFLGDNAYDNGTDAEFQRAFFEVYPTMLKNTVAWSTRGNHERDKALYYEMYANPTGTEAFITGGGVASGTEEYFSYDYANIHFIVLESYDLENSTAQQTWLEADIAATNQDWIIAFFHHPPYTRGTHNSETEQDLIDVRANFVNRLEAGGVDLILNGHSHAYERSYFLHGHTGKMATFNSTSHTVGTNGYGDGKLDGDGAYKRDVANPKDGAVYVVSGSAGKTGVFINGGTAYTNNLDHPAMYTSQNQLGSSVVEIEDDGLNGQNLNLKFLTNNGVINDYFTINKPSLSSLLVEKEAANNQLIKIYPVPANSFLNIDLKPTERLKKVRFYNTIGALIKETDKQQINVANLKNGMYMIVIETDQNSYYKSILIE